MNRTITIFIFTFCLLFSQVISAQQLNIEYNHFIGGDSCETGASDAIADNNSIVITGYTGCNNKGDIPLNTAYLRGGIYVTKVDEYHNIIWSRVFGGSNIDYGESIIKTNDNGFAVLGWSNSSDGDIPQNYGSNDIVILKLDASGNKIWCKNYGSPADDRPLSITTTSDNGFLILGTANGYGNDIPFHYTNSSFVYDWFLLKVDSAGNKEWCNVYGGSGFEESQGAVLEIDGYFYLVGSSESTDHDCTDTSWHSPMVNTGTDIYVLKIDTSGAVIWSKSYGGSYDDVAKAAMWDDRDNTILLYGYTSSNDYMVEGLLRKKPNFPYVTDDALIIKIDTSGKLLWVNTLGSTENDRGSKGLMKGPYGGYMVNSYTAFQIGGQDDWIFVLDKQGKIITDKVLGGKSNESSRVILPYGNKYAAIGYTTSDSFIEGVNTSIGYSPYIYVSTFHYFPVSITNNEKDSDKDKIVAYPNPNEGYFTVELISPNRKKDINSYLEVRDINGKVILKQKVLNPRSPNQVDASAWSSGTYYLIWKRTDRPNVSISIIKN